MASATVFAQKEENTCTKPHSGCSLLQLAQLWNAEVLLEAMLGMHPTLHAQHNHSASLLPRNVSQKPSSGHSLTHASSPPPNVGRGTATPGAACSPSQIACAEDSAPRYHRSALCKL